MVIAFVLHQYDVFLLFYNTMQYNTQINIYVKMQYILCWRFLEIDNI